MNENKIIIKRSLFSIVAIIILVIVCLTMFTDVFDEKAKREFKASIKEVMRVTKEVCDNNFQNGNAHISLYKFTKEEPLAGLPVAITDKLIGEISVDNECNMILSLSNKKYKAITNHNNDIEYKKKSKKAKCELIDKNLEVGAKVLCDEQSFNVIEVNDNDITLFSSYNIDIKSNIQNQKDINNPSVNPISFDKVNNRTSPNNTYCQRTQYGCNIYEKQDKELVNGVISGTINEDSNIKIYVDRYAIMLDLDSDLVSSSLITKSQLEKLGCISENNDCKLSNKPWLYNTTYWTKTYYDGSPSIVWRVISGGFFGSGYANYDNNTGLRPVITITKQALKR